MPQDYDDIFEAYYRLFRGEASVPTSTDDEYIMGITFANKALGRWSNYDATYWKELWTTNQISNTGAQTITANDTTYTASTNMREPGGEVRVLDSSGSIVERYPIVDPQEKQFKNQSSNYAYFTGSPNAGFTLNLNPAPGSNLNGLDLEYDYYKNPTQYTTGSSVSEVPNTWYIVHDMLAQRYQIERNYGGYQIAKRDAEEYLKNMQQDNNSGSWGNPWSLPDRSGSMFGV